MSILNNLGQTAGNLRKRMQAAPLLYAEPGLYHYLRQDGDEQSRLHLRIDADGSGFLLVNASRVVHLNPTAVQMTYLALEKAQPSQAAKSLQAKFRVSKHQALNDYVHIHEQIEQLVRPDGACPIHDLDLEINAPFSARPSAPYRMDLAITYRCNNDCSHCYNARATHLPRTEYR